MLRVKLLLDLGKFRIHNIANAIVFVEETYTVWVRIKGLYSNSGLSEEEYLKHYPLKLS